MPKRNLPNRVRINFSVLHLQHVVIKSEALSSIRQRKLRGMQSWARRMPALPTGRVTRIEAICVPAICIPPRSNVAAVAQIGGIQTQARDDGKSVPIARINRDPTATTASPVMTKVARRQRRIQQSRVMQGERNGAGTVVSVIIKRAVAAAPHVRFASQRIHGPNRVLDVVRRV